MEMCVCVCVVCVCGGGFVEKMCMRVEGFYT